MNAADARDRAIDYLCSRYRDRVTLNVVKESTLYGASPVDWFVFEVSDPAYPTLDGAQYVAVSRHTGEVRD